MRTLLTITAVLESATGLALLAVPSLVASVLLGAALEAAEPLAVARIAGAALLTIGIH